MSDVKKARELFIERFGLAFEADRLPRIAGRIMGLLLLESGPLGFEEISDALRVSRGSVSTNSRLLEALKIIERVTKPGDRRDYFQITAEPGRYLLESAIERLRSTRSTVTKMREALGKREPTIQSRLLGLERFYSATMDGVANALTSLDAHE